MGTRMIARRTTQTTIASDSDEVIFGLSLPRGTVLNGINGIVHAMAIENLAQNQAVYYGIEGWVIPITDPDASTTFENLWDIHVPKDTDVQSMDLDDGSADVQTFFEPGETDWGAIFDIGIRPRRIFQRLRMVTVASMGVWKYLDTETPFAKEWRPQLTIPIKVKKKVRVKQPSVVLFGFSSPAMTDTTPTKESQLLEAEWGQVQYIDHMLERAQMDLLGLTETGAETPWEEATDLLQKHLDPDLIEENGDSFKEIDWKVFAEARIDHTVMGRLKKSIISTGR